MYDNFKNNKNLIIIGILVIIILFFYFKNKKEHLTYEIQPVLNIAKIYADASGTTTFNILQANKLMANNIDIGTLKVKDNNIDISGNINITTNNLKIIDNLDLIGTLNISQAYYTCTINGSLNMAAINGSMNIIASKWWNSDRKITSISRDKNKTIANDLTNGIFTGFDKNKIYILEANIHLYINVNPTTVESFIARWKKDNQNEELTKVIVYREYSNNISLNTIIFATGSDSYSLTLQKNSSNIYNNIDVSITIAITEI